MMTCIIFLPLEDDFHFLPLEDDFHLITFGRWYPWKSMSQTTLWPAPPDGVMSANL
jgi:hypothetical protein